MVFTRAMAVAAAALQSTDIQTSLPTSSFPPPRPPPTLKRKREHPPPSASNNLDCDSAVLRCGSSKRRNTTGARRHVSHSREALFESGKHDALASEPPKFDSGCLEAQPASPVTFRCNDNFGDAVSTLFNEKQRAQGDIQKDARKYKYGEKAAATYMPGDTPESMRQSYLERQEEEKQNWENMEWESATEMSRGAGEAGCEVGLQIQSASSQSGCQHCGFAPESYPREPDETRLWTKDDYRRRLRVRGVDMMKSSDDKMLELLPVLDNVRSPTPAQRAVGLQANDSSLQGSQTKIEAVLRNNVHDTIFQCCPPKSIFDWNAWNAWSQPRNSQLPSTSDDRIAPPCPEIAVFFKTLSFMEKDDSAPIPRKLERCMFPDGIDRCFPFLFVELETAKSDLDFACLKNLYQSSQALYNMYLWMAHAEMEETFFENIRVLSIAVSAREFRIRLHRSSQNSDGSIAFHFDEFPQQSKYTRDELALRINAFLSHRVPGELHRILREAYEEVVQREKRRVRGLRKARGDLQPSKRVYMSEEISHLTNDTNHHIDAGR